MFHRSRGQASEYENLDDSEREQQREESPAKEELWQKKPASAIARPSRIPRLVGSPAKSPASGGASPVKATAPVSTADQAKPMRGQQKVEQSKDEELDEFEEEERRLLALEAQVCSCSFTKSIVDVRVNAGNLLFCMS